VAGPPRPSCKPQLARISGAPLVQDLVVLLTARVGSSTIASCTLAQNNCARVQLAIFPNPSSVARTSEGDDARLCAWRRALVHLQRLQAAAQHHEG